MPLVITMKQGSTLFVDDKRILCGEVHGATSFDMITEDGRSVSIDNSKWAEVYPEVKIKAGIMKIASDRMVRVMIDAPLHMDIVRGELVGVNGNK